MDCKLCPMSKKKLSDGQIIELSVELLSERERHEIRQHAQNLMLSVRMRDPRRKMGLGKMGSFELLYKLGRFLNEEYPD